MSWLSSYRAIFIACIAIWLLVSAASLLLGVSAISLPQALKALIGQGDPLHATIIWEMRLPRALLGGIIGAGLGATGAALQGFTRNDLAAPGLLGFTACAALGAVGALYFGHQNWVIPAAIIGALIGAALISWIARRQAGASGLVLAGIGIGALATAATGLLMNLAPNPWALSELVYWLMGSLKHADMGALYVSGPLTLFGLAALIAAGPALRALSLGEETAQSLGISLPRTQWLIVIGAALAIGSGVAVAGAIGFVGLFIPHILRFLGQSDPARLIPLSAVAGAAFLVSIDMITRVVSGPGTPLYLGIVTSLIGVPFFLYLHPAVQDVSVFATSGQFIALVGPNGSGKSSLIKAAVGLIPHQGKVILSAGETDKKARARQLAYLAQARMGAPLMTVRDIVSLGRVPHLGRLSKLSDNDLTIVEGVLAQLDLQDLASRAFGQLSGGEQARVLLGRALAVQAEVILADEPIAALDPHYQLGILEVLRGVATQGATVVVALHDLSLAECYADNIWVMDEGKLVAQGPPQQALSDDVLREVFQVQRLSGTRFGAA